MKLHEQTQRFILLLIFYLLGPVLTLGIIGGIVLRKLPENARSWERTLAQQTGLHWTIKSVEYRSPGFVRLHEVGISDNAAQPPVFYTKQIDIRRMTDTRREEFFPSILTDSTRKSSAWHGLTNVLTSLLPSFGSNSQFWQITAPMSVLVFQDYSSEDSAFLVQNMLRKMSARLETLANEPVQFVFEEIYVISEHSQKSVGDKVEADLFRLVQGNLYRTPTEIRSDWSFEIQNISNLDRLQLSFVLSAPEDTLEITLQTGRQPIPCDLAAVFYPAFKSFSGGTFLGEFVLSTRNGRNSQTIRLNEVSFRNVPLAPLVGTYSDFSVEGTIVSLEFEEAVFSTEGFNVKGCLQVKDGAIENALFHRCVGNFQLRVEPEDILDSEERMIPFSACMIHFHLQPRRIDFWAAERWRDAFMYQRSSVLERDEWTLYLPIHRRAVSYHELLSVFVSDSAPIAPLTPHLQSLLPYVPIQ